MPLYMAAWAIKTYCSNPEPTLMQRTATSTLTSNNRNIKVARLLPDAGPSIGVRYKIGKVAALHTAIGTLSCASSCNKEVVALLLFRKAVNCTMETNNGRMALDMALYMGAVVIITK